MSWLGRLLDSVTRHLGGTRILALPLLRLLALIVGYLWVLLAPASYAGWDAVDTTMLLFLLFTVAVLVGLWHRPATMLALNLPVLMVDVAFALALVRFTGGALSTMYLALLLIAGLQSYYYGIRRGALVAVGSGLAYLGVVWPAIGDIDAANLAIRLAVLLGTALAVGVLADAEEGERRRVLALSVEARERERFIGRVVEELREGVFALDAQGQVVAWNRAMEEACGLSAAEAVGKPWCDCFARTEPRPVSELLERLLRGEMDRFDLHGVELATPRGERRFLNVKASLLRDEARPAGAVVLVENVTRRVALERAARQSEKLAALGTLAAGLAHELNNPIGIISTRAELLLLDTEASGLAAPVREDLQVIHRHAQRVARITQGLLSFARQSSGPPGRVDLNRLVDETLLLIEKAIVRDGISLRRALAPGLPEIWGDANALQQVVMNLLTNAWDAVQRGGEISIETGPTDPPGGVRLAVRDTGSGIPPEALPRIFDPFFTTKANGTGLGLAIAYGIIKEHQGTVDVQTKPGEGTTFVLTFARAEAPGGP